MRDNAYVPFRAHCQEPVHARRLRAHRVLEGGREICEEWGGPKGRVLLKLTDATIENYASSLLVWRIFRYFSPRRPSLKESLSRALSWTLPPFLSQPHSESIWKYTLYFNFVDRVQPTSCVIDTRSALTIKSTKGWASLSSRGSPKPRRPFELHIARARYIAGSSNAILRAFQVYSPSRSQKMIEGYPFMRLLDCLSDLVSVPNTKVRLMLLTTCYHQHLFWLTMCLRPNWCARYIFSIVNTNFSHFVGFLLFQAPPNLVR